MSAPAPETPHPRPPGSDLTGDLYQTRFSQLEQVSKRQLWQVLCSAFFQKYVQPRDAVVDLGAGFCEFINNIECGAKYAVDLNPDTPRYASAGVQVIQSNSARLDALADSSIDVVFASNFFEHLPDKAQFIATLREVQRILRPGSGRLLILQPNIRLLNGQYWDFLDHHLPLTERTLVEGVELVGLQPVEIRTRFLPYTTKGRLPQHPLLVRTYLSLRPLQWLLGKQTWMVALKRA